MCFHLIHLTDTHTHTRVLLRMWDLCGKTKKKGKAKKGDSWGMGLQYHVKKSLGGSIMVLVFLFTLAMAIASLADQTQNHVVAMRDWIIVLLVLTGVSLLAWITSAVEYARMGRVEEWSKAITADGGKAAKQFTDAENTNADWLEKVAGKLHVHTQFTLAARVIFWTSALLANAVALVHAGYLYWNAGSGDLLQSYTSYLDDGWPAASAYGTFPVYEKLQMLFWVQVAFFCESMSMVFWAIACISSRLNDSESLLHRAFHTGKLGTRLRSNASKGKKRVADNTDSDNNNSAVEVGSSSGSSNNNSEEDES